jgi:catechol 2,3-dioxygenase-like lactoylglutathione lyase family enzyme
MELRVELFVASLDVFADFYTSVLGFAVTDDRRQSRSPYLAVRRDEVRIGAVPVAGGIDHSARAVPVGTELVLEVDDLAAERDRVVAAGWPLESDLRARSWGLTDFRLHDPDGYYLRFTDRRGETARQGTPGVREQSRDGGSRET